jgi:hypothetical protein
MATLENVQLDSLIIIIIYTKGSGCIDDGPTSQNPFCGSPAGPGEYRCQFDDMTVIGGVDTEARSIICEETADAIEGSENPRVLLTPGPACQVFTAHATC